MSTLGTLRISASTTSIPEYGTARADVLLEAGMVPSVGPATLTLADLSMRGTIVTADLDAPDLPRAVWVNGAGWDLPLPGRSYGTDAGVRLSTVLKDLIADVKTAAMAEGFATEFFDAASMPADRQLEKLDLRPAGSTGRDMLGMLHRVGIVPPWWVASDGSTHFGPRPSGPGTGRATVIRRNAALGMRYFGLDSPAGWLPGTSLESVITRRLVIHERASSLTANAYSRNVPSMRDSVAAIAERDHPESRFAYPRTFVVRTVHSDGRIDLDPPADAPDLRPLNNVEQWTMGSALTFPDVGTSALVAFRDARESRAVVIGIAPSAPGSASARQGDHVGRWAFDATVPVLYYSPSEAGAYAAVAPTVGPPLPAFAGTPATITTGSAKVKVS
jgi:hypothetical protein